MENEGKGVIGSGFKVQRFRGQGSGFKVQGSEVIVGFEVYLLF